MLENKKIDCKENVAVTPIPKSLRTGKRLMLIANAQLPARLRDGMRKRLVGRENELFEWTCIITSKDPVVGTNQTRKLFLDAIWRQLISGRYGEKSEASVYRLFTDLSADVQKFWSALCIATFFIPSGVNEKSIHSMTVSAHLGKNSRMNYDFKDFSCSEWNE